MDVAIEELAGLKPPYNWRDLAKQQNDMTQVLKLSTPVSLGACVANAAQFNWAAQNGVTGVRN